MSSTIFYRFRSQKATSRILFDGTGITVFDLKKEIISENKLGDGTSFDLRIYNSDTNEEYADDSVVIPRSTSVIARRSPPAKHGKGTASRYVTGKSKITRITINTNSHNQNNQTSNTVSEGMTEEERINAMFANQSDQWKETQQVMAGATPVYNKPAATGSNNPEDVPPPGYMCYRCGSKDHWIKNCPTNDDPNWEGKRVKRTTGIPKTYLKTVENPDDDPTKSYMMNEEGKYVVQVADDKTWQTFKKKLDKNDEILDDLKASVDPRFLNPTDQKIMKDPVTTPCCNTTYSRASIEDLLLESDFVCPKCGKADIFLDQLKPEEDLSIEINSYLDSEFEKRGVKRTQNDDTANKRQDINGVQPQFPMPMMPMMPFPPFGMMPPLPADQN